MKHAPDTTRILSVKKNIFFKTCRGLRIDIATLVFRALQGASFARIIILLREILTNTDLPLPPYFFYTKSLGFWLWKCNFYYAPGHYYEHIKEAEPCGIRTRANMPTPVLQLAPGQVWIMLSQLRKHKPPWNLGSRFQCFMKKPMPPEAFDLPRLDSAWAMVIVII